MIRKIVGFIFGSDPDMTAEQKLLNYASFMFLLFTLLVPIQVEGLFKDKTLAIPYLAFTVNCGLWYFYSRKKGNTHVVYYFLFSAFIFLGFFMLFEKHYTPSYTGFMAILTFTIIFVQGRLFKLFIIFFFIALPTVLILKRYMAELYLFDYGDIFSIKNVISQILIFVFIFIGLLIYRHYFEKEKKKNLEQHNVIIYKNKKLEEQKLEIESISAKRAEFFTHLAHEMRTPITLINNYINQYFENEKNSRHYRVIKDNISKLLQDVEFYLNAEKLQRNLNVFNHDQVINISEILDNKLKLFIEYAKLKQIKLNYEVEPGLIVKADPFAIDAVLNNLIDNALKFSNANNEVIVSLSQRDKRVVFTVKDFGPGIPENEQKKIFKKFYQGQLKNSHNKGLGIGLSIVSDIINELDGMIDINSEENEGTEFMITLSRYIPKADDKLTEFKVQQVHIPTITTPVSDSEITNNKKSILLVEDNHDMLSYLKEELSVNYNIYVAESGNKALDKLVQIAQPQLIITDVMMDDMDGFTFVETISDDSNYKHIPVIFLTAKTTIDDKHIGLELGAVDYISKPFSIVELKLKIEAVLKNSNLQKQELLQRAYQRLMDEMGFELSQQDQNSSSYLIINRYKELELTKREIEISNLIIDGLSNKEISENLNISVWTVAKHIQNIFDKAKINTRIDLINKLKGT